MAPRRDSRSSRRPRAGAAPTPAKTSPARERPSRGAAKRRTRAAPAAPPVTASHLQLHEEVEWQFDAPAGRVVERWLRDAPAVHGLTLRASGRAALVDVYLDTDDWRFYRAGYALRLRKRGASVEATLKSFGTVEDGARRRREITQALGTDGVRSLARAVGPVAERVRRVAGRHPLHRLFEVRTDRRIWILTREGLAVGEIALDATTIPRGRATPARLDRVEIEVGAAAPADLLPFVEALRVECHLVPPTTSKFGAGLAAHGLTPTAAPDLGTTRVDGSASTGEVAIAALRRELGALLAHEAGARLGDEEEPLHRMRVAARRMRAAIEIFGAHLPARLRRLQPSLDWAYEVLGESRELDIALAEISRASAGADGNERAALAALHGELEARRTAARATMVAALDSPRWARLMQALARALVRPAPRRSARARIVAVAPRLIRGRYRKMREAGDRLTPASRPEAYHALRKRCRRLRYALEFHADVYGKRARGMLRRLIALQSLLGAHQDGVQLAARLRAIARDDAALGSRVSFAAGQIAARATERAAQLRDEIAAGYRRVRGKRWRKLRRALAAA